MKGLTMNITTRGKRKYLTNEAGEVVQMECTQCKKIHDVSFFAYKENGFNNKRAACKKCSSDYIKSYKKKVAEEGRVTPEPVQVITDESEEYSKAMILYKEVSAIRQQAKTDITKQFEVFAGNVPFDKNDMVKIALKEFMEKYSW